MNTKRIAIGMIFLVLLIGIILYPVSSGLLLILGLMVFGALSLLWKEKEIKLMALGAIVILAVSNIGVNGLKFGIDFSGGTRLPVILEQDVPQETMNEIVQTIKKRASTFGLTEVKVRAIGTNQINVEVPSNDEEFISKVEDILSHQGVFLGIVDGKVALNGKDILPGTITKLSRAALRTADWGVSFSVTKEGADNFAETVEGKADYPLYMFLDRPVNAVVFISEENIREAGILDVDEAILVIRDVLKLGGDDIEVYAIEEMNLSAISPRNNETVAIVSVELEPEIKEAIKERGFELRETELGEFVPILITDQRTGQVMLEKWEAVGLLSSPILSAQVTDGIPNYGYIISGSVSNAIQGETEIVALEHAKRIESILKGGVLPVQISLGSRTSIPAPLGEEFLKMSLVGIVLALIAISLLVSLRYKRVKILLPIVLICFCELIILLAIIGSFTIDLAGMAGIIAAIGVGVDAQIVITDELLKEGEKEEKLNYAFQIITTNVVVAIVAMVPLLFSGMVEIIGFAIATMLGSLLGILISRPAYAAIVEDIV